MTTLGELIGIARECKGWTLRDLEARCGVSNALISQIETGKVKDPGFTTVIRIIDVLGLKLDRAAEQARSEILSERARNILRSNDAQAEIPECIQSARFD